MARARGGARRGLPLHDWAGQGKESVAWLDLVRHRPAAPSEPWSGVAWLGRAFVVWHGLVGSGTAGHGARGTPGHGKASNGEAWHTWHGIARPAREWRGAAWLGLAWSTWLGRAWPGREGRGWAWQGRDMRRAGAGLGEVGQGVARSGGTWRGRAGIPRRG